MSVHTWPSIMFLLFLAMLAASTAAAAAAAGRCDAPFKTLSSDCRGAFDDTTTVCLVNNQRASQTSPCTTGSVKTANECAVNSRQLCDVLSYNIKYQPTQARFQIKFTSDTASARALQTLDSHEDAGDTIIASSTDSSGAGDPMVSPRPQETTTTPSLPVTTERNRRVDYTPTPPPSPPTTTSPPGVTPHNGARVDYTGTPRPTPTPPTAGDGDGPVPLVGPSPSPNGTAGEVPRPATRVPPPGFADFRGDNSVVATESNEFIEAIGVLRLDPALTELRIIGGTSEFGTRGKAVKLTISPQMLTQSPRVTSVWIVNCNIGDQLSTANILRGMPTGMTDLTLRNTLMRTEPSDLSALQNLRNLNMGQNYLSTVSSKVTLPKLTMLDLSENALTLFEASLPALESLNLNKNNLKSIPNAVYAMKNLQELYLTENPIAALVLSQTQYNFLKNVRLKIDKASSPLPTPVVYVPGPNSNPAPSDHTGLVLDSNETNINNAQSLSVGTLTDLQGIPVWRLPDAMHEIFTAQQDVLEKAKVVIGGKTEQSYQSKAADAVSQASVATDPTSATIPNDSSEALPNGASIVPTPGGLSSNTSPSDSINGQTNGVQDAPTLDSQTKAATSNKTHKTLLLSLVVVAAIAALAIVIFFFRRWRRSRTTKTETSAASTVTTPHDKSSLTSYHAVATTKSKSTRDSLGSFGASFAGIPDADVGGLFSSRRIRTTELNDVRVIGAGSSAMVWLVKHLGSRWLASKRLIDSTSTDQRMAEFVSEIVIAADLDHPSIIRLVGVAWTNETDLQALFEYVPNGDLQTYLQHTDPVELSWASAKLQLAIDIVEALVYTHSFNPPLLHRDLRAKNILLDEDFKPKLSNFGSARFASEQNTMTIDGVGSGRWLAPEILSGSTDYEAASDIYAFGVLLCELDTHTTPYEDVRDASGNAMAETALLEQVARGALRPTFLASCPVAICELATSCLANDRSVRPSAIQIAYELRVLMREWRE